ncbi:cytochrome P450 [Sphingobium sp. V4]|uniref:cytochrome P450 n=1 Tax=Sphingobium sp. V4 TaxID=3038927 RepID=UPI002558254F|nr:cytochrome P450 [Sphingobium sp. V4]WIW89459.1 cytochrome P450 [Sphingobium sp. V4]
MVIKMDGNLPQHLIFDFDLFNDDRLKREDIHLGYRDLLAEAPPVFFTPRNGGHWVVQSYDLVTELLKDHNRFSAAERSIPKAQTAFPMIPLYLDPPEHGPYRSELMRYFSPAVVRKLNDQIRTWARRLIADVADKGGCEFTEAIGARFPVSVFMEIMGMPLERFPEFRQIVGEYFAHWSDPVKRDAMREFVTGQMREITAQRRVEPRDDFFSHLVTMSIRGRDLTDQEIESITLMMFVAGLDTVAGTLGFTYRNLAERPDIQQQLRENPERIGAFVEESLRRYSVVLPPRVATQDCRLGEADVRAGDMILASLPGAGFDPSIYAAPEKFELDRTRPTLAFGTGAHVCLGNFLARAEMRILTEEWVKAIPTFRRKPGSPSLSRLGPILALDTLELEWDRC